MIAVLAMQVETWLLSFDENHALCFLSFETSFIILDFICFLNLSTFLYYPRLRLISESINGFYYAQIRSFLSESVNFFYYFRFCLLS